MVADHRYRHLDGFRSYMSSFLSPLIYIANFPSVVGGWFGDSVISRSEIMEENARLRDENLILKAKLQRLISLESENVVLRRMLGSVKKARGRRAVAEIISVENDRFRHIITINKGSLDDVYVGQPVLDDAGVVGQVKEVSSYFARVLMITDKLHSIPARVERNGVRAIASGVGVQNAMVLNHVPQTLDIQVGDTLVSSGLGRVFPAGFPVAKVEKVVKEPGEAYSYIEVSPIANLQQSSQVVLVWPPKYGRSDIEEPQAQQEGESW